MKPFQFCVVFAEVDNTNTRAHPAMSFATATSYSRLLQSWCRSLGVSARGVHACSRYRTQKLKSKIPHYLPTVFTSTFDQTSLTPKKTLHVHYFSAKQLWKNGAAAPRQVITLDVCPRRVHPMFAPDVCPRRVPPTCAPDVLPMCAPHMCSRSVLPTSAPDVCPRPRHVPQTCAPTCVPDVCPRPGVFFMSLLGHHFAPV